MKTKGMVAWIALIAMTMGGLVTPLHAENIEGNENLITKDIQIDCKYQLKNAPHTN